MNLLSYYERAILSFNISNGNNSFSIQSRYNPANIRLDEDFLQKSCLQDVLIKTNIFASALRLQKTSSRRLQDVLVKTNIFVLAICLQDVFKKFSRRLQDVLKTFSRGLQDVFKTSSRILQGVFKTSSRRPAKISSRGFQGVPLSYFVLLSTSSRSIQHVSLYRGICLGNTISEKFMVSVQNLQERDIKLSSFSFSLYYTFSWLLTEACLEPGRTSTMAFFCGNT